MKKRTITSRKIVCLALTASLLALGLTAEAEQAGKIHRIGFLSIRSGPGSWDETLKTGLRDLGYIEGKNIAIVYRWAEGKFDRFPGLAAELVQQDRKSTRLNSSHIQKSRMPSSA